MTFLKRFRVVVLLTLILGGGALLSACQSAGPPDLGAPTGWDASADGMRWWQAGIDTTGLFRDLATLGTMNVRGDDKVYVAGRNVSAQQEVMQIRLERALKQQLIRIYRNQPEIVDSLFNAYVAPDLSVAKYERNEDAELKRLKKQGYSAIRSHFREPITAKALGTDIPITYPDSLRAAGIGGSVHIQAYVDAEGKPQVLELIEPVHPVLDAIALQAMTQMEWGPAYINRSFGWKPIPSWARFRVTFAGS
ncbi:MAG: hypothetical protein RhofKO_00710 [Rhodothermales bacterium]